MNITNNVDLSAIDFNVVREPLFTKSGSDTGREAIIRTDTDEVIGLVSPDYKLLPHKQMLIDTAEAVSKLDGEFKLTKLMTSNSGAKMFAHFEGKRHMNTNPKVGDLVAPHLIVVNSVDATMRFGFRVGAMRLACTNGMVVGKYFNEMLIRHTSRVEIDDVLHSASDAYGTLKNTVLPQWEQMHFQRVTKDFVIKMSEDKKIGIPDMVNKRVIELARETDVMSLWDLYNHYTFHMSHEYKGSDERRMFITGAVDRVITGLLGNKDTMMKN